MALGDCHLRAEGGVAVHVVDVIGESGVGVMEEGTDRELAVIPSHLQSLVNRPLLEPPHTLAKKAKLRGGPKAAVPDPTPQKVVLPTNLERRDRRCQNRRLANVNSVADRVGCVA